MTVMMMMMMMMMMVMLMMMMTILMSVMMSTPGALLWKARLSAHVVNVELQVAPLHDSQY